MFKSIIFLCFVSLASCKTCKYTGSNFDVNWAYVNNSVLMQFQQQKINNDEWTGVAFGVNETESIIFTVANNGNITIRPARVAQKSVPQFDTFWNPTTTTTTQSPTTLSSILLNSTVIDSTTASSVTTPSSTTTSTTTPSSIDQSSLIDVKFSHYFISEKTLSTIISFPLNFNGNMLQYCITWRFIPPTKIKNGSLEKAKGSKDLKEICPMECN